MSNNNSKLEECAKHIHDYIHADSDMCIPINAIIDVLQCESPPYMTKEECEEFVCGEEGSPLRTELEARFPQLTKFIDGHY